MANRIGRIFPLELDPGGYIIESIDKLVKKEGVNDRIIGYRDNRFMRSPYCHKDEILVEEILQKLEG